MRQAARIKTIRSRLGWTQLQMAEFLGLNRSRVSRMENGQNPTGSVAKLLEQLEVKLRDDGPAAAKDPLHRELCSEEWGKQHDWPV